MKIRRDKKQLGGWGSSNQERAEAFRRGHKVGQKVRGRLIRWEGPGFAWVNIGNQPLLAHIQSRPAQGAQLTFLIQKLHPEIVLKEIFAGSRAGLPVFDLITEFNALRAEFEATSSTLWERGERYVSEADQRKKFFAALPLFPEASKAFLAVTVCVARINAFLSADQTFGYWPWMHPGARNQAGMLQTKARKSHSETPFHEVAVEFESPNFGLVQSNVLYRFPTAGYRIQAQHFPGKLTIEKIFDALPVPAGVEANCIGLERLPAAKHGGLLSELLLSGT